MSQQNQLLADDLESIIASYMRRIDQGETVNQQQFLLDHPHLKSDLEAYFADVALIEKLAGPAASDLFSPADVAFHPETVTFDAAVLSPDSAQPDKQQTGNDHVLKRQFGRYQIEKILGEGGMGAVYLAYDTELERRVALKVPKIEDSDSSEELLERFYREARAAATLRHRGICPVYDVGSHNGISYIAMAYIAGMPLSSLITRGKIKSMRNIGVVIRKLALALESAHQNGVIHRDLKPANIMVDEDNEPVIMDFGLARQLNRDEASRITMAGTIMGSPAYMSPEQVSGDINSVGPQSDIYNLGVILYELLTGQVPFQGPVLVIIGQIIGTEPSPPSALKQGIDRELEAICLKMMAKKTEDRFQSMQDVVNALSAYLKNPQKATTASPEKTERNGSEAVPSSRQRAQRLQKRREPRQKGKSKKPDQSPQPLTWFEKIKGGSSRAKIISAAGFSAVVMFAAVITLLIRVGDRTVEVTLDDPTAVVTIDGDQHVEFDGKMGHVELDVGPHEVTVTRNGATVTGYNKLSFTVAKKGRNVLEIKVQDKQTVAHNKPKENKPAEKNSLSKIEAEKIPNDPRLHNSAGAETVHAANDYDRLATVEWLNFFETIGLRDFQKERARLQNGLFELNGTGLSWPLFSARNLIFRAKVKKVAGRKFEIFFRSHTSKTGFKQNSVRVDYPNKFSFARQTGEVYQDLKTAQILPVEDSNGFIEIAFAAINERLTLYVNGTEIAEVTDDSSSEGSIGFQAFFGAIQLKDVEVMLLDTPGAGDWRDLISDIDMNRDAISGNWENTGNTLRMNSGGYENILRLSSIPQGSYELEFAFTRHILLTDSKAIALALPVGNRSVDPVFFGWGSRKISGLSTVGGLDPSDSRSPCRTSAFEIEEGKRHEIRFQVLVKEAEATITAFADGKKLYSWQGDTSKLSSGFQTITKAPPDTLLLVNHGNGKTTFHKLRWRPIAEK